MTYRPLIRLSAGSADTYLPCDTLYSAADIAKLKKHLPKSLTLAGVDASEVVEEDREVLEKEKLKVKSVAGKDRISDAELRFHSGKQLKILSWEKICVVLDVPCPGKDKSQTQKEDIETKLTQYVHENLVFRNRNTQELLQRSSTAPVITHQLDLMLQPGLAQVQAFDKEIKSLRAVVTVSIIVEAKPNYTPQQLWQAVEDDLLSSLKILVKNKMTVRVVRSLQRDNKLMILQSYAQNEAKAESEGKKLEQLLKKKNIEPTKLSNGQQNISQTDGVVSDDPAAPLPEVQSPSNRTLLLILLGMFALYIYLKLNPLKSTLSQL